MGRGYLVYRWLLSLLTLTLLAQSLIPRLLYTTHKVRGWHWPAVGSGQQCQLSMCQAWQYLLYLGHWVRMLAALHHTLEAVMVTHRWRTELQGSCLPPSLARLTVPQARSVWAPGRGTVRGQGAHCPGHTGYSGHWQILTQRYLSSLVSLSSLSDLQNVFLLNRPHWADSVI